MIYPPSFPMDIDRPSEQKVFNILKKLNQDNYDVFYSRKFVAIEKGERNQNEADFIIADIRKNDLNDILIIEVNGGIIKYDGIKLEWTQT